MPSPSTAADVAFDAACVAGLVSLLAVVWTASLVAVQALITALILAAVLLFLARRLEGGGQTTPLYRPPRHVRRDAVRAPEEPVDEADDRWAGVRSDEIAEMQDEREEVMP